MFVDPGLLHAGANESRGAGAHAEEGAGHLSRAPLAAGMFGEFAAADEFHEALSSAHAEHVRTLQAHKETLTSVSDKAHYAATTFTNMDQRNRAEMRAVRGGSGTSGTRT